MQIFFHCADGYSGNELMLARSFEMTMESLLKKQETESPLDWPDFVNYITCFFISKK